MPSQSRSATARLYRFDRGAHLTRSARHPRARARLASARGPQRRARPEHGRVDRAAAGDVAGGRGPRGARRRGAAGDRARARDRRPDRLRARALGRLRAARGRASSALAYGDELGALVAATAPQIRYERGMRALPVDFRSCREDACAEGRDGVRVASSLTGEPAVAFTHVVDCRPGTADAERRLLRRRGRQSLPPVLALLPGQRHRRGLGRPRRGPGGLRARSGCRATTRTTGSRSSSASTRTARRRPRQLPPRLRARLAARRRGDLHRLRRQPRRHRRAGGVRPARRPRAASA